MSVCGRGKESDGDCRIVAEVKEIDVHLGRKLTETDRSEDFVAVEEPWGWCFMVKWIGRLICLDRFRVCLW